MSVTLHTSLGDLKIEVFCEAVPKAAENFLALCASGAYDGCIFHRNIKGFMIQTGDPTGTGKGGQSIWGKPFGDEIRATLKFNARGIVAMANSGPDTNKAQFFFTYAKQSHLDAKYTIFGKVIDGADTTLDAMERVAVNEKNRPLHEIKINSDFSACIFVDGVEVEYFEPKTKWDESEEGREVMHAYIVGEPGKNFTVSWKDHRGTKASSGHIFVDGKDVASAIMRPGRSKPVSRSGAKVSADKLRPFKFANLNITSDDKLADKKKDKERLKEMSTIRLEITYVQVGPVVPFKSQEIHEWGHVHEQAKALGLMTEYDPKIAIPASRSVATRRLNPDQDGPDVQFIFTYATRAHLMAADIIPNPRAPKNPKPAKVQDLLAIEDDDEPTGERVSAPRSPSKRQRSKSNKRIGSEDEDEDRPEVTKRPKLNGAAHTSSPNGASTPEPATPPARRDGTEDDLEELQRHLDQYNLQQSQEDDGDEGHVETVMRVNDEESQDL
ncbi:unnamed protein product [Rhizoctonia solani]|uniref:Peptidyl-prolyl cis-trans isomerase-like 3 n=1 Tax=Rhizoctonia solani TaxID=456999 RepID=A0A8H3AYQ4_9AGAM|nr:unnamed protein product [Rhizoctonia solani]